MKHKFFPFFVLLSVVLGTVSFAVAGPKKKALPKTQALLAMLPASDIAMTLNAKRLFDEALPQILATKQSTLAQIFAKMDQIKQTTGIDLRQFSDVAVGVSAVKTGEKTFSFEPMILARGSISSESLMSIAKTAGGETYREETIGGKTVYVFSAEKMVNDAKGQTGNSPVSGVMTSLLSGLSREMALATVDENTVALGSIAQMRSMLEAKTKISPEVTYLVSRKPGAIISFGAAMPDGLSTIIDIDNDALGSNIDSIKKMSGALDVADGLTTLWIAARTNDLAQANDLREVLLDMQKLGKVLLSSSKGNDKRVYQRMVENAKITQAGLEVALDLKVPQSDIDVLVAQLK